MLLVFDKDVFRLDQHSYICNDKIIIAYLILITSKKRFNASLASINTSILYSLE